jgi:hypothetical protein
VILTDHQRNAIALAGGGLVVDAPTLTFNELHALAVSAHDGKAQLVLKNVAGLSADQLQRLAAAAPGRISFDLTS